MINEKHRYYGKTKVISLEELSKVFHSELFNYIDIVLLFGSRAVGSFHDRSDYDFAVLSRDEESEAWGIISKVWVDIGSVFALDEVDYDVIDLSRLTPQMKTSIKNGYKIVKGSQDDISRILR